MLYSVSAFNLADGAILLVLVLALIRGIRKGLSESLSGFVFNLLLLVAALYLASVCTNPLLDTPTGQKLYEAVYGWSESWGTEFTSPVFFNNGTPFIYNEAGEAIELRAAASNSILGMILGFLAPKLLPAEGGASLADAIVPNFVAIVFALGLFIVFFIILKIIFKIVEKLAEKFEDAPKLKWLDKLLGVIVSVILGYAFALFVFGFLGIFENFSFMASAVSYIENSAFASAIWTNNPIRLLFINMFGALGA